MTRTQAKSKTRTNIRYPISNFFVLLVKAYRVGKKCTTAVYVTVTAVKSTKTGIARIAIFQAGVGPKQSGCQIWVVDLSLVHTADLEADTCAQSGHSIPHSRSKIRSEVESQSCTCPPPTSPRSARFALTAVSKPDGAQRSSHPVKRALFYGSFRVGQDHCKNTGQRTAQLATISEIRRCHKCRASLERTQGARRRPVSL